MAPDLLRPPEVRICLCVSHHSSSAIASIKSWRAKLSAGVSLSRHCCPANARFDGQEFLRRWKGKKILFVGDSISLNQWESLACMLHAAAPASKVAYARGNPVSSVTFQVRAYA